MYTERMAEQDPNVLEVLEHKEVDPRMRERYDSFSRLGELMLGGSGFGVRIDPEVETFMFDAATREILVSPELIERKDLTVLEQLFIFMHEVGHLVQLVDDPDAYLDTFDYARSEAGKQPDESVRPFVEEAWRRFFNVFKDMHVNALAEARNPQLQRTDKEQPKVSQLLYNKWEKRFRGAPKTEQFLWGVLLGVMCANDQAAEIDPEMRTELDRPYTFMGKQYASYVDFARKMFFDGETSYEKIHRRMFRAAVPLFERFLQEDIDSGKIRFVKPQMDLVGGEPDEQAVRQIANGIKRSKESGSSRAKRLDIDAFRKRMKESGFEDYDIAQMAIIRGKAERMVEPMMAMWSQFFERRPVFERTKLSGFRTGRDVSVNELVRQADRLHAHPDDLRVFDREIVEIKGEQVEPKQIDLSFVLDCSGSMSFNKRRAVQEAVFALSMSLIQHARNAELAKEEDDPSIRINIRMVAYGDHAEFILHLDDSFWERDLEHPQETEKELWKQILRLQRLSLGGTNSVSGLEKIEEVLFRPDSVSDHDREDKASVVIEITDGETDTRVEAFGIRQSMDGLNGVYSYGIQIPGSLLSDRPPVDVEGGMGEKQGEIESTGAFQYVWGDHGVQLADISQLPEALARAVSSALKQREGQE